MYNLEACIEDLRKEIFQVSLPFSIRSRVLAALLRLETGDSAAMSTVTELLVKANRPRDVEAAATRLHDAFMNRTGRPTARVDAVVVTALHAPELTAVLGWQRPMSARASETPDHRRDGRGWIPFTLESDLQRWHRSEFKCWDGSTRQIVCGSPCQMGMVPMAVAVTKAITVWKPSVVVLCGIAAGTTDTTTELDILVPERVFVHDAGKWSTDDENNPMFLRDPWTAFANRDLVLEVQAEESRIVAAVRQLSAESSVAHARLKVHTRPLACGNSVMDSSEVFKNVVAGDRKTIGLEMESFATLYAANTFSVSTTRGLVIKVVSDFGADKSDEHQRTASWVSAEFARVFLETTREIRWEETSG